MKKSFIQTIIILSLCCIGIEAKTVFSTDANQSIVWTIPEKKLPLPFFASENIKYILQNMNQPDLEKRGKFRPMSTQEWEEWIEYTGTAGAQGTQKWADKYGVLIKKESIAGVNVFYLTPKSLVDKKSKNIFIYLHGGAYIFGGGLSGLKEAILIASRVKMPVISIDYRMPPHYPYPAALNDVTTVYKTLIRRYNAQSIAMGGSSSGGGLALAVVQKLKSLHIALPGALFIGTPWADLSKSGDSLYVNEGIDRKIVTYDGFVAAAARLYAHGHDIKEPGLSPVYGDFIGFPPTMLVSGTRDLFLSLAVRVHRKMKAAGVIADLNVYEGLSHVEYFVVPDAPESKEVYQQLRKFLKKYLTF